MIEAAHPIVSDGEMTAHALGHFDQPVAPARQLDDAVALMDAGCQGQIAKLGPQRGVLRPRQGAQPKTFSHPLLLAGKDSTH